MRKTYLLYMSFMKKVWKMVYRVWKFLQEIR